MGEHRRSSAPAVPAADRGGPDSDRLARARRRLRQVESASVLLSPKLATVPLWLDDDPTPAATYLAAPPTWPHVADNAFEAHDDQSEP